MTRPNILISGLTAAGKTTHAKLLAAELGYRYTSATEVIADMIGVDRDEVGPRFWYKHGAAVRKLRYSTNFDQELDAQLVAVIAKEDGLVVDAWAVPWLDVPQRCISIWIESDQCSRTLKAAVSDQNRESLNWYRSFILAKDDESRERFLAVSGFDLYGPRDIFDLELENTNYITKATRENADRGIAGFRVEINRALRGHFAVNYAVTVLSMD